MISFEEERQKPYFLDNDFYDNKYNISTKLRYFCIKEGRVYMYSNKYTYITLHKIKVLCK